MHALCQNCLMAVDVKIELDSGEFGDELNAVLEGIGGGSATVVDAPRTDSNITFLELLKELKDGGRDFTTLDKEGDSAVGKAADEKLQSLIDRKENKKDVLRTEVLTAATTEYARQVAQRILKGKGIKRDLTERYKLRKRKLWGFVYPIGKASGDLLDFLGESKVEVDLTGGGGFGGVISKIKSFISSFLRL